MRKVVRRFSITTAHVVFFDYFSGVPWVARLAGIRHVIYEMQKAASFAPPHGEGSCSECAAKP